jgi:tetratricopeptide (TPR) repeat protein
MKLTKMMSRALAGSKILRFLPALAATLCAVMISAPRAYAQSAMPGHDMGTRNVTAPQDLPAPLKLDGIGNVHMKITATPEAQMWFNQGLNLLHDFWDYESERAFEQAVRVDPRCAMCYWGLFQAETFRGGSRFYARKSLAEAVRLKGHGKSEKLYIEEANIFESALINAKPGVAPDTSPAIQILRKLVARDRHDTQARIFLARALMDGYDDAGQPRTGQKEAMALLQQVLKDEPDNSAAHHYWIHAIEAGPHPEQALHSAEILASLAPTSGHMVHMPGHIFYRVGDYQQAEKAFAVSMEADERYMQAQHVSPDNDWNYVHNLMYAIANLMEEGKLKEADNLSAKLVYARGDLGSTLYIFSPRDSEARLDPCLPVALRTGDWTRALALLQTAEPSDTFPNLRFLRTGLTDFATGMLAVESNDLPQAEGRSGSLDAQLWRISEQIKYDDAHPKDQSKDKNVDNTPPTMKLMPDALAQPLESNLSVMSLELRATILMARKKEDDARKLFDQAASEEKALGYREPPIYIRPVGETEAAAWMRAGEWAEARKAYERALEERPRSGFSLYGLAICSEKSGDAGAARAEYQDFISAWKVADADLPQIAHARAYLSSAVNTRPAQ